MARERWGLDPAIGREAPTGLPVLAGHYDDPDYLSMIEAWIFEIRGRVEALEAHVAAIDPLAPDATPSEGRPWLARLSALQDLAADHQDGPSACQQQVADHDRDAEEGQG